MYPNENLQPGQSGDQVKALQQYLVGQGHLTQADMNTGVGIYGPKTTAAVAALQSKLGVDNTGAVGFYGPKTLAAIQAGMKSSMNVPTGSTSSGQPIYTSSAPGYTQSTPTSTATTPPAATSGTPSGVTTPSQYESAVTANLAPTAEENNLTSQMTALDNSTRMLNEGEKAQDLATRNQPIALDFITGQQKSIAERYSNERTATEASKQTLQQQLANAQAKRQVALDVNKFQLEREDKAKADAKAGAYTLNAGDSRFDASGKLLSSVAAKPSTASPTGTIHSGSLVYSPQAQSEDSQALEASRTQGAEADGKYADPNLYLKLYKSWTANGGSLEDFLKQYPPKNYINPANTWLPPYLKPAGSDRSL